MHDPLRKRISRRFRGWLRTLALSRNGIGVLAQTRNGLLVVDPRDFGVARALLADGGYAWEEIAWLGRLLDRDSRLVFAGAHVGSLLVPLALGSGARDIEAFEPSPANHRLLKANLALNGLAQSTTVHPFALGDTCGSIPFTHNIQNSGNSRISRGGELAVELRTLDSVLPLDRPVDLMVVDTEGFEVHALRGAAATLDSTRFLYLEYAPEQLAEQGASPEELLKLVSERFPSMYLPGRPARFFAERSYLSYLRQLPPRRGLLLNLLFCRDTQPDSRLLEVTD
jgi:FkbM family methyltransferase